MSRIEAYSKFIKTQSALHEMAGPGKRGPKTKEQKAAEAAAEEERQKAAAKFKAEHNAYMNKWENEFAPRHLDLYKKEMHEHLSNLGYSKVHEGDKKIIYTKTEPEREIHHIVYITKPHGEWNKHSVELGYSRSSGTGYGPERYQPNKHGHGDLDSSEVNAKEYSARSKHKDYISRNTNRDTSWD